MSANVTKGHRGFMYLKKTTATAGAEFQIPYTSVTVMNPTNDTYIPSVNRTSGPSVVVRGVPTPGISVRVVPMEGWFTKANLDLMFITEDATINDTPDWSVKLLETNGPQIDIANLKWGALSITHSSSGNMLGVELGGICTTLAGTALSGTAATVAGTTFGPASVQYGAAPAAAISHVRGWSLNIIRAQAYDIFSGGPAGGTPTTGPQGVSTGQIGGTLTIDQSPNSAAVMAASGDKVRLIILKPSTGAAQVSIDCYVNLDAPVRSFTTGFGTQSNTYTLLAPDGSVPVAFVAP